MTPKGIFARPGALIAVIVAIVVAMAVAYQSKAATPFPDAANARFSVTVTGTGPDVILIPGLGCSRDVWDATVARFEGTHRLHVLNIAGFAGEPAGANAQGEVIAPSVEALNDYIVAQKLQKPVIVGHSMGGLMALMLAKSHPDSAGKLVIIDALPFVGLIFDPNATTATVAPQAQAMRDGVMAASDEALAAQQRASTSRLVTAPANVETVAGWSLASDRRVFAQSFYEDVMVDMRPDLAAIKTPAVVIVPYAPAFGQTADATVAFYKTAYSGMPQVSFVPIGDSLHFIMLDQPEAFYTALDAALN